jgi:hypothetical protein
LRPCASTDVARLADIDPASHSPIEVEYRTFDGLVVELQSFVDGDKHWAHFAASFDEDLARRYYVAGRRPARPRKARRRQIPRPRATPPRRLRRTRPRPARAMGRLRPPDAAKTTGGRRREVARAAPDAASTTPAATAPVEPDFSAARTEADTINGKVEPWVFVIGSYKYEQIDKHVADMLKEEEDKAAAKPKAESKKPAATKPAEPKDD